uniref:Uncharacterized protein n=1 Tax=Leptobrachium leishanense TaxID=445787 RepID=A0A8C5QVY0_9ANUR
MDQFKSIFTSSPEADMNLICVTITAISMIIYKIYKINCPCLPGYNLIYGFIVMFFPPMVFFFFAFILAQQFVSLVMKLSKPQSKRKQNKDIQSLMIRALVAPILWIIVCFLDGKAVICAFSETVDAEQFGGFGNYTTLSTDLLLAKVPCKNFELLPSSSTRKAIYRFLKSTSQAIGFLVILSIIGFAAASHILSSIFNISTSIRTRYWRVFADTEDLCFEETCLMYNRWMAERCIKSHVEDMEKHGTNRGRHGGENKIISPWQMMDYIDQWYYGQPPIIYERETSGSPSISNPNVAIGTSLANSLMQGWAIVLARGPLCGSRG